MDDIAAAPRPPAVPPERSISPEGLSITCLDCGQRLLRLARHVSDGHGLTPEAYRERWGLPSHYPMEAPVLAMRGVKARHAMPSSPGDTPPRSDFRWTEYARPEPLPANAVPFTRR